MPLVTILYGLFAIALGLYSYSKSEAMTALIPAWIGIAAVLCGLLALKPSIRKHAMHFAAVIGLVGAAGGAMALPKVGALFNGTAERPLAVQSQLILFVLSVIFLMFCIGSFRKARRSK